MATAHESPFAAENIYGENGGIEHKAIVPTGDIYE